MSWEEIGSEGGFHSGPEFTFQLARVIKGSSLVSGETAEESDSVGVHRGRTHEEGRARLEQVGSFH